MKTKKVFVLFLAAVLTTGLMAGCGGGSGDSGEGGDKESFDPNNDITVVSREEGSGTRGAFIELMGIEEETPDGQKVDNTTKEAVIANKTDVVLTNVAGDPFAIGYISMGSMNDTVKALKIDGVEPTTENVKNGSYSVSRPFNIATKGDPTGLAKDFIDFILSKEGQEVVSDGYIPVVDNAPAYSGSKPSGKIVIAGSSSVTPIMEKLQEAYQKINPDAEIEIQMSDSTTGMTAALEGTCDIGMASRDLKDEEAAQLKATEIALDGISIVVNPANTVEELTSDNVKDIFTGKVTNWSEIIK